MRTSSAETNGKPTPAPDLADFLLSRDLKKAGATLTTQEVRYAVDLYYQLQEFRKAAGNMLGAATRTTPTAEPSDLVRWFADRFERLEKQVPKVMETWATARREGRWLLSVHGIGPVIAAGLLAQFDIERAPTVGHFWSFAGLKPKYEWKKGEKRPFNLPLKVLCWKLGDSFVKQSGSPKCVYGKVYLERKEFETKRDLEGYNRGTEVRKSGKTEKVENLPPFILDLRARRYAVKLCLAHLHHVMHEVRFAAPPPKPYILTKPEHTHFIAPPGWPCE